MVDTNEIFYRNGYRAGEVGAQKEIEELKETIVARDKELMWYETTVFLCCMIADMEPDDPVWKVAKAEVNNRVGGWREKNSEGYEETKNEIMNRVMSDMLGSVMEEGMEEETE